MFEHFKYYYPCVLIMLTHNLFLICLSHILNLILTHAIFFKIGDGKNGYEGEIHSELRFCLPRHLFHYFQLTTNHESRRPAVWSKYASAHLIKRCRSLSSRHRDQLRRRPPCAEGWRYHLGGAGEWCRSTDHWYTAFLVGYKELGITLCGEKCLRKQYAWSNVT